MDVNWKTRADIQELMDDPACPPHQIRRTLVFLRRLNAFTLARRAIARRARPGRILDIATGGADIPRYLLERGIASLAVGIDLSRPVLEAARTLSPGVALLQADARWLPFKAKVFDTAISHLFFHHLGEADAVRVLREMDRVASRVVALDLLRRRDLYWIVRLMTLFTTSELARHDGPASVRRSFSLAEVRRLAEKAGIPARIERFLFHRWRLSTF